MDNSSTSAGFVTLAAAGTIPFFPVQSPGKACFRALRVRALRFASEHSLWFAGLLAGLVFNLAHMLGGNHWLPIVSRATTTAALACWILATGHWEFW